MRASQDGQGAVQSGGVESHCSSVEEPETPAVQRRASDGSSTPLNLVEQMGGYRSLTEGAECPQPASRSSFWSGFITPSDRGCSPSPPEGVREPELRPSEGGPSTSQDSLTAPEGLQSQLASQKPASLGDGESTCRGPSMEDHGGVTGDGELDDVRREEATTARFGKFDVGAGTNGSGAVISGTRGASAQFGEGEEDQSWVLTGAAESTGDEGSEETDSGDSSDKGKWDMSADRQLGDRE